MQANIAFNSDGITGFSTWWRHQMETFSALLAICAGNSPVNGEFPSQRPVTRNFDVFFDLRLNKRLSKQSWCWCFETPSRSLWRHCNDFYHREWIIWFQISKDLSVNGQDKILVALDALLHASDAAGIRRALGSTFWGKCNILADERVWFTTLGNEVHHDDVIKWKHFPRDWPFVRGIHRSTANSPQKGQWRGASMFSLIFT